MTVVLLLLPFLVGAAEPPVVVVDRDDVVVAASCTLRVADHPIADANGDGVVHVTGDGVHVRFAPGGRLRGAAVDRAPDTLDGVGIRITGRDVVLEGAAVSGFKVGILASGADGLEIRGADLSENFRQRLGSTPTAEDAADWLRPHENDGNEWMTRYGAAVWIEDATGVTVEGVRVRRGQNGIVLDRVTDARVFDNDCSFLSGWGLALWRSSRNVVSRNAFDFCVRGYSHGVYNRGQDSAGILAFEQCSDNVFAENSATHGGDGFFAFAGQEALGAADPRDDPAWYAGRGCNRNLLVGNDFSDAAAHGIEITFSFGNHVVGNRVAGDAICGVWGGYSQDTIIEGNVFEGNGELGYGLERGGVNIEHGTGNVVRRNLFRDNACGVHLWWDPDEHLLGTPWARANHRRELENAIQWNDFRGDRLAIHLRRTGGATRVSDNRVEGVGRVIDADAESPVDRRPSVPYVLPDVPHPVHGVQEAFGARARLRGREHIVMTEWGPYEWDAPRVVFDGRHVDAEGRVHLAFRLLDPEAGGGRAEAATWRAEHPAGVMATRHPADGRPGVAESMRLTALAPGVHPVRVEHRPPDGPAALIERTLVAADWTIRHFASAVDPREDPDAWRAGAADAVVTHRPVLAERYGMAGPGAGLSADRFGTIATTVLPVPAGRWRLRTRSDDGIRVWLDGVLVIDDWTWHPPRTHEHAWTQERAGDVTIRVEHFELDGWAVLELDVEPAAAERRP